MTPALLPRPRFAEYLAGTVTWRSPLRVAVDAPWREVVAMFASDLRASVDWDVQLVQPGDPCDVEVRELPELGGEEYQLAIGAHALIEASSPRGLSYALTTLRQLGPRELWSESVTSLETIELPCLVLQDGPEFEWRGAHLDVARHFFDVATVCRHVDLLAAHRLNRLHLHLNDDQGWRVEVPGWPRLGGVASTRRSSPVGHSRDGVDDGVPHGGCFSVSDLELIRDHARRRQVEIIPEIDLPGHAQAVIAAHPELGNHPDEPLEVWTRWGVSEHVLNVSDKALAFADEVVSFVADLFPDSPVHIGGDECPTIEWEASDAARAAMAEHGFTTARELQGLFTERAAAALRRRGHEVVAWDEVLDAVVPAGTVIMAWRSVDKAIEAARRGLDVVMATMEYLYFDWLSSADPAEPVAVHDPPSVTTWEKVYGFSVTPLGLEPWLRHHVRGAQAQLWSEYIATRDQLDYMVFPRLCAFSEVVWGTATSESEFRERLSGHLERLAMMGVRFRNPQEGA